MVFFFVLFLFLDEIWDLIESVSEGFPTYFFNKYVSVIYMYAKVILKVGSCPNYDKFCPNFYLSFSV